MARIRTVKPELAQDEVLARLSIPARYTFLLVISRADDYGLLVASSRQLLGALYPHDADVTEAGLLGWIEELVGARRLRWRETRDGARVLEVVNWARHQAIKNPGKPLLRDALKPVEGDLPETCQKNSGNSPETLPQPSGKSPEPCRKKSSADRERDREGERDREREYAAGNWPADAHALYAEHIGLRPIGEFAGALKPAVDRHGWPAVRPWFEAYCRSAPYRKRDGSIHGDRPGDTPEGAVKNVTFCSPADFVKTLTVWQERCAPLGNR